MGKKGKEKKESKSKGKDKKEKESAEKKPLIDAELLKDLDLKDVFRFWNGDVYLGQFQLTPQGEIFRQGRGKYFAGDGRSMVGQWNHDVLVGAERLSYPDGSWSRGAVEDGRHSGPGVYGHPQLGSLACDFLQGRPEGLVTLTDNDDNKWQGRAVSGQLTLLPRNHFFDSEEAWLRRRHEDIPDMTKDSFASKQSKPSDSFASKQSKPSELTSPKSQVSG